MLACYLLAQPFEDLYLSFIHHSSLHTSLASFKKDCFRGPLFSFSTFALHLLAALDDVEVSDTSLAVSERFRAFSFFASFVTRFFRLTFVLSFCLLHLILCLTSPQYGHQTNISDSSPSMIACLFVISTPQTPPHLITV